jgi:hypothetical protein
MLTMFFTTFHFCLGNGTAIYIDLPATEHQYNGRICHQQTIQWRL